MGKVHERLDDKLIEFIGRQHMFLVGTAPDSPDGHLNISPKGLDTFRILGPLEVREDGGELPLGAGRQRALLALLLLCASPVCAAQAAAPAGCVLSAPQWPSAALPLFAPHPAAEHEA